MRERERERHRQTDRQTDRQTNRQTETETDIQRDSADNKIKALNESWKEIIDISFLKIKCSIS